MDLRRLARLYQTAAVVLTSSVLLTAVVLLALHLAFPLERSIWQQNLDGRRLSEGFVPEHYYLTDAEQTEQIRRDFDGYVLAGHWQVHPWTGLINRQHESAGLNVDAEGRRAGLAPSAAHAGRPPLVLWAFGGSTLFGWGVADVHTVPSQLQAALQERFEERQVRVRNLGVPWYNSAHQLALLAANLRRTPEPPDAVLFLDGLNDLVHRVHYHSESPLHPQLFLAWEERLDAMFAPPPWIRIAPSLPLLRAARTLGWRDGPGLGGLREPPERADRESLIRRAASDYRANRRMAEALCDELGVLPFFFLQPVPMWLDESRTETTDPDYRAFGRLALAGLDAGYAMSVERDGAHYSDVAGRVLAAAMVEVIAKRLDNRSRML